MMIWVKITNINIILVLPTLATLEAAVTPGAAPRFVSNIFCVWKTTCSTSDPSRHVSTLVQSGLLGSEVEHVVFRTQKMLLTKRGTAPGVTAASNVANVSELWPALGVMCEASPVGRC